MAKQLTKEEAKTKVYELTKRLAEIEKSKRASNADYKDQINDVKGEIADIIEAQEGQNTAATKP